MKTYKTKKTDIKRSWHLFDAKDKVLGRLASEIAQVLIGKKKPYYASHLDCGDYTVVLNASKVAVTGRKEKNKVYYHHSGYPGGLKQISLANLREKKPTMIIERAVSGMLPKNKLRDKRLRRLFVFEGEEHPYKDKDFIIHNLKHEEKKQK